MSNIVHEIDMPFRKATFGMGCFWANDALFGATPGVLRTRVGYSGGTTVNPTYKNIGDHTEVIEIDYDPSGIAYEQLLQLFWTNHEYGLTTKIKKQYASLILYHDNDQKDIANKSLKKESIKHLKEMCTEIKPAAIFYPAEDYHQKYRLQQHADLCKAIMLTPELLQKSHVAARLNGYVAGVGTKEALEKDLSIITAMEGLPVLSSPLFESENICENCSVNLQNSDLFKSCCIAATSQRDWCTPSARGIYEDDLPSCRARPPQIKDLSGFMSADSADDSIISISSEDEKDDKMEENLEKNSKIEAIIVQNEWEELPEGALEIMYFIEEFIMH
ncbi:hypothetical protein RN001_009584 [Aquatica leii]|uniref:peptide-methionine (S)-S-oxide reductase n=1 Tax=Aquatica leii TaxID=1421715 RepID=A0AAN7SMZ1_9COLE|nr:hypothetical protein RN001_009584 [Aquatica leii]